MARTPLSAFDSVALAPPRALHVNARAFAVQAQN